MPPTRLPLLPLGRADQTAGRGQLRAQRRPAVAGGAALGEGAPGAGAQVRRESRRPWLLGGVCNHVTAGKWRDQQVVWQGRSCEGMRWACRVVAGVHAVRRLPASWRLSAARRSSPDRRPVSGGPAQDVTPPPDSGLNVRTRVQVRCRIVRLQCECWHTCMLCTPFAI